MSKELAVRDYRPFELTEKQVTIIANTSFVPSSKRGKIPEIWASIFAGRAMGIDDMTAINKIHIIQGTPAPSAHLASAVVRLRGHSLQVSLNEDGTMATAIGKRADTGDRGKETFSMDDAKRADLLGKDNWKKYPKPMLKARATTAICNSLFSDCFMGGVYTPDELGADIVDDDDVIEGEAVEVKDDQQAEPNDPDSLRLFKDWARDQGLTGTIVADACQELFPGRTGAELSGEELAELRLLLEGRLQTA